MKLTGAQIVIEALKREGVDVIFGIPGGAIIDVYDALYDSGIRHILAHHEQGAAHMADGYARATGKVGVCFATSGPGATNLTTGIANAYMDSVPIVAITGQVATGLIGKDAFQEADTVGITSPITKHNYLIRDVNELAKTIKEAFYIAKTGRPGPVLIDIPKDIQIATADFDYSMEVDIRGYKPSVTGHIKQIKEAAKLINESKKPCILAGGGVIISGASEELFKLATKANIPVATTFMGIGSFPQDHPLSLKSAGMHGNYAANYALTECDLLIAIGCRFSDRTTGKADEFATRAKKIHIDIDPAEINKNVVVDIPIVGDAKIILNSLLEYVEEKREEEWLDYIMGLKEEHRLTYADGPAVKPQFVIEKICEMVTENTVIVTEVGQNQMWSALFFTHKKPRHFISSGGLGTMGFGFPASIGAKVGRPDALVIDIAGDGSFMMNIQEIATAVENNIPVKVIVLNNRALGMVRQWQELFYKKRYSSTILKEVNFAEIAKSFGAKGIRVTEKEQLVSALSSAIDYPGPAVVDVIVEQEENVIPMVPPGAPIDRIVGGK